MMTNSDFKTTDHPRSILLVDDDRLILSTLTSGLTRAGYQVSSAESVDAAEVWLNNNEPDLVILDVRMPDRDGLELTNQLDEFQIPFILLTAYSEQDVIQRVVATGAMGYLVKPVDITQLIPAIETALTRSKELYGLRGAKQQLQIALDADRAISVAVGIVMDQHRINHDEALEFIRNTARSKHLKLIELASNIVNSRENLNLRINT
ncbi:MAG: response regulator [Methylotenera sp.]|nr:response regulator [Methylotenera sp.]